MNMLTLEKREGLDNESEILKEEMMRKYDISEDTFRLAEREALEVVVRERLRKLLNSGDDADDAKTLREVLEEILARWTLEK